MYQSWDYRPYILVISVLSEPKLTELMMWLYALIINSHLNIKNVLQQYSQQYNLTVTIFISIQLKCCYYYGPY